MQTHFENVQKISDTTTLPFAMHYLRSRIMEELDISHLTEKLLQGKGESNALTPKEKLDTWEKIKILSMIILIFSLSQLISVSCFNGIYKLTAM
jgi:peroxin-3